VLITVFSLPAFVALISAIYFLLPSFIPLVYDLLARAGNNLSNFSNGISSISFCDNPRYVNCLTNHFHHFSVKDVF